MPHQDSVNVGASASSGFAPLTDDERELDVKCNVLAKDEETMKRARAAQRARCQHALAQEAR